MLIRVRYQGPDSKAFCPRVLAFSYTFRCLQGLVWGVPTQDSIFEAMGPQFHLGL